MVLLIFLCPSTRCTTRSGSIASPAAWRLTGKVIGAIGQGLAEYCASRASRPSSFSRKAARQHAPGLLPRRWPDSCRPSCARDSQTPACHQAGHGLAAARVVAARDRARRAASGCEPWERPSTLPAVILALDPQPDLTSCRTACNRPHEWTAARRFESPPSRPTGTWPYCAAQTYPRMTFQSASPRPRSTVTSPSWSPPPTRRLYTVPMEPQEGV